MLRISIINYIIRQLTDEISAFLASLRFVFLLEKAYRRVAECAEERRDKKMRLVRNIRKLNNNLNYL
ncbi:MAG: hypothetical protein KKB77_08285 [Bacteroidetes bacterium]|nr:hypothetical protein [Bacteroidota bacterium]